MGAAREIGNDPILLIVLVILLLGGLGGYHGYSRYGGPGLGGVLGLVLIESREGLDVSELLRATTGATCLRERAAVNDWSTRALSPL